MVGNVRGVMRNKVREQAVNVGSLERASLRDQPLLDHAAGAAAPPRPHSVERHRLKSFTHENGIERGDEIGGGIDQGSVEVKNNGWGGTHAGFGYRRQPRDASNFPFASQGSLSKMKPRC